MIKLNIILSGLLIGVTFIVLILAYYSNLRKEVPGAKGLFYLCMVTSFYTFGYSMELVSSTIESINFWSKFQYIGLPFIPALWVILAIGYVQKREKSKAFHFLLFMIPILTGLFRWTSEWHHLQYGQMTLVSNGFFWVLAFEKGPWYYLHFIYFFLCAAYTAKLYSHVYMTSSGYRRQQSQLMLLASCIPIVAILLNVSGMTPLQLDSGPFFVLFNYAVLAYGIFRYKLLNIIPLSREKVFDWISDGVIVTDLQLNILDYNPSAKRIFDALSMNSIGNSLEMILGNNAEFMSAVIGWQETSTTKQTRTEREAFHFSVDDSEGRVAHYQMRLSDIFDSGRLVGTILIISDTTQQHEMLLELERVARTDKLTGLLNRGHFVDLFNTLMADKDHEVVAELTRGIKIAVIIFDIDHFKAVNDQYGHSAGDLVLKMLAERVQKNLRQGESLCRYGGEEFVILLSETSLEAATLVCERLRRQIESLDCQWEGNQLQITASFGLAYYEASQEMQEGKDKVQVSFDHLLNQADKALYLAKAKGRNCLEIYNEINSEA